jgi:formylmethanofuran dehydrogenase subunit E|uniref:Formylmethanofuran dehydrogenase n=1 Tax=Desulfobacca acetoxidans TaxID=60893 RepID=A0A7V6A3B4_9BACT
MEQDARANAAEATFEELLAGSVAAHGHLCPGQIVGVRMALLGLRLMNFEAPPTYSQLKQLIVFIEMDRCTGDAVAYVTNVKLGRRSLKFVDYGIMAATFVNLESGQAFRVISTEESRDLTLTYAPLETEKRRAQVAAYRIMPDSVLFRVQQVQVDLTPFDLPGPTRRKVTCVQCGQVVRDNREVVKDGLPYCRPCAGGGYFSEAREITWEEMNWAPMLPRPEKVGPPIQPESAATGRRVP